jgi:hypothetical protein
LGDPVKHVVDLKVQSDDPAQIQKGLEFPGLLILALPGSLVLASSKPVSSVTHQGLGIYGPFRRSIHLGPGLFFEKIKNTEWLKSGIMH